MTKHFPLEFTLENGSHVLVNKTEADVFEFTIKSADGPTRQFTYVNDGRSKTETEESLEFEEVDALRTFWLEMEDMG